MFRPIWWLRNNKTSRILDIWMNDALDNPTFSEKSDLTIMLNKKRVWIGNYPYAYGSVAGLKRLPSRKTALRLENSIIKWTLEQ